ncbi:kinase-like domain-containing protein [Pseudoneurospora amorphoporcata]|uniref:cyclin-dependent kinase n=1 Tax=Pseudoneurospora amorphoporcata TaxID=241081 RepID=A0AAN6NKH0_9PEZI|nr:kinase-like domain-containing protein [Pseudoneurospora amorphoporcata]
MSQSPENPENTWKQSLTATTRYDSIQKLQQFVAAAGLSENAFALEKKAYESARTREEYDAFCNQSPVGSSEADQAAQAVVANGQNEDANAEVDPGVTIGDYPNCHYIASGVTADVYRAGDRALKVIVETRNIEPHNPTREAKLLGLLSKPCIPLLDSFHDHEQRLVLVFPYMPLTLENLRERVPLSDSQIRIIFGHVFTALASLHGQGIIHRDVKPSAILLESPTGPAYLSDFGASWHPTLSAATEPADNKILDIGTGPYRAPEVLFGNHSYGPAIDMWGTGVMLAECCREGANKQLFESRAVHEDGNQLGLILSIFKTIGSPTRENWPEAVNFRTPPFDIYRTFETRSWDKILPDVTEEWRELISALVKYDSGRATAKQALQYRCMNEA